MRENPKNGEVWRHFKGNLYKVWFCPVKNASNTMADDNEYVMYQPWAGNPNTGFYICELKEFMSPVDKEKYPNSEQEWRFEKVKEF